MSKNNSVKGQVRQRRVSLRTCIGCRETDWKHGLIRIVRRPTGVQVDPTGKQGGRGAYIHAQRACWESALQGQQVARALRMEIGPQDQQRLQAHAAAIPDAELDEVS